MSAYESVVKIREMLSMIEFKDKAKDGEDFGIITHEVMQIIRLNLTHVGIELKKLPDIGKERQMRELAEIAAFWRRQYVDHEEHILFAISEWEEKATVLQKRLDSITELIEARGLGDVLLEAATLESLPSKSELEGKLGDPGLTEGK